MPKDAAMSPHRPLDPHQWNAKEKKSDEVRDQKRTATILGSQAWEAKKVPQPNRIPCDSQDNP
jgi:hypothetical protein